jgi:hypothetical protein
VSSTTDKSEQTGEQMVGSAEEGEERVLLTLELTVTQGKPWNGTATWDWDGEEFLLTVPAGLPVLGKTLLVMDEHLLVPMEPTPSTGT